MTKVEMKPIQLEEFGDKHWLVDLGVGPATGAAKVRHGAAKGGAVNVARERGHNGAVLLFDDRPAAETWIKANHGFIERMEKVEANRRVAVADGAAVGDRELMAERDKLKAQLAKLQAELDGAKKTGK